MSKQEHKKEKTFSTLHLLLRMITFKPRLYLFNLFAWIGVHNLGVLSELIGREFFNLIEKQNSVFSIFWIILLTLAAAILRIVAIMLGSVLDSRHRSAMRGLPQRNLMHLLFRRPGAELLPGQSGEAVATIRDECDTICDGISWSIDMFGEIIALVIGLLILTSIDFTLALTVYLPLIFVAVVSRKLEKLVQNARERAQAASAAIGDRIGDIFAAIQSVQVAGAEAPVLAHLKHLYTERRRLVLKERLYNILFDAIFNLNFSLITAAVLLLAAERLLLGSMSIGDLMLFINYVDFLTEGMLFLGSLLVTYFQCGVGFQRLSALLRSDDPSPLVRHTPESDAEQALPSAPTHFPFGTTLKRLEIKGLSAAYTQGGKGIREINLRLPHGSFTVVTGMIGSGKTTLLRAILGLVEASKGEIYWNDTLIEAPADFFTPSRSAYVAQLPRLLSASLRENIALGEPYEDAEILKALETVNFATDLAKMKHGLNTEVGSRGVKLSGGQVQRVATARALARRAELLVFDDLSSALDLRTEQILWENLAQTSATFLIVSHRRAAFHRADQIIILDDGRISAQGTWQELLQSSDIFRALWNQTRLDDETP